MTPTHLPGQVAIPHQKRGTTLERFNTAPAAEVQHTLLTCLHSPRWAHRIAAHRPYPTSDALLAASDEAAYDLTPGDLTEALAGETLPELPQGAYSAAHTALDAANAAYEAKFGHVFVICLDDLPPNESLNHVLTAIRSRLTNDPEEERVVAWEELRHLARGRLAELLRDATSPNGAAPDKKQDTEPQ
ncbi:2-oxo-4-hydroxy-4-carboxy-5-ureidoimidazoline decarboxylase [Streptomyces cupreus]|uniref:2-oxo-4-hydroxy-4-carboxy-5-ureidoimidazoline decarboxylase n=1 Tax=Streptomyces cupreus TaxID=2759956 RepID=A0A7X1MAB1_9ACTN|nr:2-oxo-4-hydroxy-4-carboxy-5-ureidoimidazoline decarboxylase [Streptomyces cupreus]